MKLQVITPTASIFEGEAISVSLPGESGIFQVLNNHTAIISTLTKGDIVIESIEKINDSFKSEFIQIKDANHLVIKIKSGVAELMNNELIVLAE